MSGGAVVKTCPDCAEEIKTGAKVCKYCGRIQNEGAGLDRRLTSTQAIVIFLVGFVLIAGMVFLLKKQQDDAKEQGRRDACEWLGEMSGEARDC